MFAGFVIDEVHHSLVRPAAEAFVAVPPPVIIVYTARVAYNERSYVVSNTSFNDVLR
jgi:hypothetical protein